MECIGPAYLHDFWVRVLGLLNKLTGRDNFILAAWANAISAVVFVAGMYDISHVASYIIAVFEVLPAVNFSRRMHQYSILSFREPTQMPYCIATLVRMHREAEFSKTLGVLYLISAPINLFAFPLLGFGCLLCAISFFVRIGGYIFATHQAPRGTSLAKRLLGKLSSWSLKSRLAPAPA